MRSEQRHAVVSLHLELAFAQLTRRIECGYIDQKFSPLGSRQHIVAVRRRLATGELGAAVVSRRYLLTIEALTEEYFAPERLRRVIAARRIRASNCNGVSA